MNQTRRRLSRHVVLPALLATTFGLSSAGRALAEDEAAPTPDHAVRVGAAIHTANLTVFPIYASSTSKTADLVSFDAALEAGTAAVRELGAGETTGEGGAAVGTLVIENHGEKPLLVLAGTVVKGGHQDRQIARDFVILPGEQARVDAFCVEHGRWSPGREGKDTAGRFEAVGSLSPRKVREAAHYASDQGEVWRRVDAYNRKNGKQAPSGSLMATLDAGDVLARRNEAAREMEARLVTLPDWKDVVGLAYAINGAMGGARWFLNHDLYVQNQETLLNTVALEMVGEGDAAAGAARQTPEDVYRFLSGLGSSSVQDVETRGAQTNRYRENEHGYASEALVEVGGEKLQVTVDYLAK